MTGQDCAVILAAGKGTRMGSDIPKVLCEVLFEPMLGWVMRSCEDAGIKNRCVVVGYEAEQVMDFVGDRAEKCMQNETLGTGHAVLCAEEFLKKHSGGNVAVLCGDAPFLDEVTLKNSLEAHKKSGASVTVITANVNNPHGYGRIIRTDGILSEIVEEKDATDVQRAVCEINSGAYWFAVDDLLPVLHEIKPANNQGEYYLTDAVRLLLSHEKIAKAYIAENPIVVMGANDRVGLLKLNTYYMENQFKKFMNDGVEFISTDGILISANAKIGKGTTILPGTIIKSNSVIGENCTIGPNSLIENSSIGGGSVINATQVYDSKIENDVKIGPFCHIRPNSTIHHDVKIGDFVEVKNSTLGAGTAVSHLTYVGDSDVGKNVNFGCGVVTVNYDGVNKNRCTIEDGAFIGCNTNLVAPVKIGKNGYTGAGSTITQDVEESSLGVARARQRNIKDFSNKKLAGRKLKVKD